MPPILCPPPMLQCGTEVCSSSCCVLGTEKRITYGRYESRQHLCSKTEKMRASGFIDRNDNNKFPDRWAVGVTEKKVEKMCQVLDYYGTEMFEMKNVEVIRAGCREASEP